MSAIRPGRMCTAGGASETPNGNEPGRPGWRGARAGSTVRGRRRTHQTDAKLAGSGADRGSDGDLPLYTRPWHAYTLSS